MTTKTRAPKDTNAEIITLRIQRNEGRLLRQALVAQKIMVVGEYEAGRSTRDERNRRLEAIAELERKVREVIR